MDEITSEFLTESYENLGRLDQELVELEKCPRSAELLASIFRTFHTLKGTAGFLSFAKLELVAHAAEDVLSRMRDGDLVLTPAITSSLLAAVDAVRQMLATIESIGTDGDGDHGAVIATLKAQITANCTGDKRELKQDGADDCKSAATHPRPSADVVSQDGSIVIFEPIDFEPVDAPPGIDDANAQIGKRNGHKSAMGRPLEPAGQTFKAESAVPDPLAETSGERPHTPQSEHTDASTSSPAEGTVRVDVRLLDRLMNLVGELVLTRNQIIQLSSRQQEAAFQNACQRLNLTTTELQEGIMKTRMQPIGRIFSKFPRIVRDLALACGKRVRIETEGENTELDRTLIEAVRDPLTHIIRNAVDHGIERPEARSAIGKTPEGRLCLRASHESGQVIIEVADDGAGIDFERVRAKAVESGLLSSERAARMAESEIVGLIFKEGLSTKDSVTNISGRGVGMDVVKTSVEKAGGTVDVCSRRGEGTTMRIKIPLTLAIIPALIVTCAGDRYAIPQVNLIELVRLEEGDNTKRIELICGSPVYRLRGRLLQIAYLRDILKLSDTKGQENTARAVSHIVVLQAGEHQFGLVVEAVNDTQEIVVKPLGRQLNGLPAFAGATIMGDGQVALILDVIGLASLVTVGAQTADSTQTETVQVSSADNRRRLLLCRVGGSERLAVPLALVARLEKFPRGRIEYAAGAPVVQYRNRALPLLFLDTLLGSSRSAEASDSLLVVVFDDGGRQFGVVIDEILDIVEEEITAVQLNNRPGLLGSAIVGRKVTDFLDLHAVLAQSSSYRPDMSDAGNGQSSRLLLVDGSEFRRAMVRAYLEFAGHQVLEANSLRDADDKLKQGRADLLMVALEAPDNRELEELCEHASDAGLPIIGLADGQPESASLSRKGLDDVQPEFDDRAVLSSIKMLLSHGTGASPAPALGRG